MGKYVYPIKLKKDRQVFLEELKKPKCDSITRNCRNCNLENKKCEKLRKDAERNYYLGKIGFIVAIRSCDLRMLRVKDIIDNVICETDIDGNNQYIIKVIEKKTSKEREIYFDVATYKEIKAYCENKDSHSYLFPSRNKDKYGNEKPLSETQISRIVKEAAIAVGIKYNISSHSLRKTGAYIMYEIFKDIDLVSDWLGHSNSMVTRRYIGIDREAKYNASKRMCANIT